MSANDWVWDPAHGQYRTWSPTEGCWVLQNGIRLPTNTQAVYGLGPSHTVAPSVPIASTAAYSAPAPIANAPSYPTAPDAAAALTANLAALNINQVAPFSLIENKEGLERLPKDKRKAVQKKLDKSFKSQGSSFFKPGKVFKVLWPEHLGDVGDQTTVVALEAWGVRFMVKIHWFMVIVPGKHKSQCLPINTYGDQGMGKANLIPEHHSIIYTGDNLPVLDEEEDPHGIIGNRMQRRIRVIPTAKHARMKPRSRLNYQNVQTIDHRSKVLGFGDVHERHMAYVRAAFSAVWAPFLGHGNTEQDSDVDDNDNSDEDENDNNNGKGTGRATLIVDDHDDNDDDDNDDEEDDEDDDDDNNGDDDNDNNDHEGAKHKERHRRISSSQGKTVQPTNIHRSGRRERSSRRSPSRPTDSRRLHR